jgi:hypothetical protein
MSYRVLLSAPFHGSIDAWTEHLCLETLPDGRIEISSRSAEVLMGPDWADGDVVWPEGYDPESDDGSDALPLTVGGKAVAGRDGDYIVGEDLRPHSDDSIARFSLGQITDAFSWLQNYGWTTKPGFADAWTLIQEAFSISRVRPRTARAQRAPGSY